MLPDYNSKEEEEEWYKNKANMWCRVNKLLKATRTLVINSYLLCDIGIKRRKNTQLYILTLSVL